MGTCCSTEASDSSTPKRCHEHQLSRDISANLKEAPPSTSKSFVYPTMPSIKAGSLGDPSDHSPVSDARINATFDKYKERHEELILSDGILRMCQDLKVHLYFWQGEGRTPASAGVNDKFGTMHPRDMQ